MKSCSVLSCRYAIHDKPFETKRQHKYYLIRFQLEGTSQITINGHVYDFRPGDLLVASPGDQYALLTGVSKNGDAARCLDYYFYCQTEEAEPFGRDYPRKMHIGMDDSFINLMKNIIYERRKLNDQVPEIQDYLVRLVFLYIRRYLLSNSGESRKEYLPARMKDFIERHATEPITLKQVASHAGLGISRASELFKSTFGQSIMEYAIDVRLNIARNYILFEQGSLEEIAYSSGFGSYTHFSRMFSNRFGVSPKKYREINR